MNPMMVKKLAMVLFLFAAAVAIPACDLIYIAPV